MVENENPWTIIETKDVYENPWIKITHSDVLDPSGKPGIYGKVHFKNIAVGILPVDEEGNTWIVGQYRFALERYSWEIPEGGCPVSENPLQAAQRELQEETGIIAKEWHLLGEADISNSVTDEVALMYVAKDLSFTSQNLDSTEDIQVKKLPFTELFDLVISGEIRDGLSVMTVLHYHHFMQQ